MPNSRKDFEHNMHLLMESGKKGKLRFTEASKRSVKAIINARFGPNKRPNLHTINEMARLVANTVADMARYKQFMSEERDNDN